MLVSNDLVNLLRWVFVAGAIVILAGAMLIVVKLWGKYTTTKSRVIGIAVSVIFIAALIGAIRYPEMQRVKAHKARYDAAKAIFDERCATAGEKIYKTVDDVEGIYLLNVRRERSESDKHDQNWVGAGLPHELSEDSYINSFLLWTTAENGENSGNLTRGMTEFPGFYFADARDENGVAWRYTLRQEGEDGYPNPQRAEIESSSVRYGVSFKNIVNPEGTQHWIAGTRVTVVDMQTSEVLAEASWYTFEHGFGSRAGQRVPWLNALTCPKTKSYAETRLFVSKVLKPKKRN